MRPDDPNNTHSTDGQDSPNIVSLAEARKRQQVLEAKKEKAARLQGASKSGAMKNGYENAMNKRRGAGPKGVQKVWVYVQLVLFLAVVAYFMQQCRH